MIPAGVSWVLTLGQRKGSVMKVNVGSTDRIIRLVAAAAAIVLAFLIGPTSVGGIILIVVGLVLAVTGLVRFCPLYSLFGMDTCGRDAVAR